MVLGRTYIQCAYISPELVTENENYLLAYMSPDGLLKSRNHILSLFSSEVLCISNICRHIWSVSLGRPEDPAACCLMGSQIKQTFVSMAWNYFQVGWPMTLG